jgi:integrase
MKITAKTIATIRLPADKADAIHFDDTLPGFGIRLRRSGDVVRRQYVVQYRHAGATRRLLLGSADVLGVEQARAAAKKALGAVALGGDPQSEKAEKRERDTFTMKALAADYLKAKAKDVRARTMVESVRYLTSDYFKPLHNVPVEKITRRDVAAQVLRIANESGATTGARARSQLSAMFSWGMQMGLCEINPVANTPEPKRGPARDRVLDDAELRSVWKACGDDDFGKVVRLLMLTGARRNEIGGMCWSEIAQGMWTLPAARAKNGRAHTLPLSGLALSVIDSVPERAGRDQLFGQHGDRGFCSWDDAKKRLDARLGSKVAKWTLHDVRRTVATRMADIGVQPHIIEAVLNHYSGHRAGPAGIYNRSSYAREMKAALALWSDHVRTLIDGGERKILPLVRDAD